MFPDNLLTPQEISKRIAAFARRTGCELVGFAPALPPPRADYLRHWLAAGRAGTMTYLNRSENKRADPRQTLPGARTIIVVAQSYFTGRLPDEIRKDPSRGVISAYAWGRDYHDVLQRKLDAIAHEVRVLIPGSQTLYYVDSGPVMERDHGERAGLGFIGKNTLLISPRYGSTMFLGVVLTTAELPHYSSDRMPTCGSCVNCLGTCPTRAFLNPYQMDASRCISYLTIEFRGIIPRELRHAVGNHIFGCDDCQDCCPWNLRFSSETKESAYRGSLSRQAPLLNDLARLTAMQFREQFAGSPVLRANYEGLMRNVAVALGNWKSEEALDGLEALLDHESAVVRVHAAWGAGEVRTSRAADLLLAALTRESNQIVRAEIRKALSDD